MTERLYYTDAYRRAFDARVTSVRPSGEWGALPGVILDRTAFYPTSGGQPHDTGTLAGLPVRDVIDAGDEVIQVVEAPAADPRIGPARRGARARSAWSRWRAGTGRRAVARTSTGPGSSARCSCGAGSGRRGRSASSS